MAPANPIFNSISFIGSKASEIIEIFENQGHSIVKDDVGYDFPELGFGLYVTENIIEAVSMYRKGYYDN